MSNKKYLNMSHAIIRIKWNKNIENVEKKHIALLSLKLTCLIMINLLSFFFYPFLHAGSFLFYCCRFCRLHTLFSLGAMSYDTNCITTIIHWTCINNYSLYSWCLYRCLFNVFSFFCCFSVFFCVCWDYCFYFVVELKKEGPPARLPAGLLYI